jgi:hypothetical protein
MKKATLMLLLATMGFMSFAQNYDKVKTDMIVLHKPEEAKAELDKIMSNPKSKDKTTGLYWNFAIYATFYGDSALSAKYPHSDSLAFEALSQYEQADTSLKALKENSSIVRDFDYIRSTGFNQGVKGFNTQNWAGAYEGFAVTVKADKFMEQHGLFPHNFIDTNTYLYAGYAAQNSGNLAKAVEMYKILVDKDIAVQSKDFENSIYYAMLGYFSNNNDQADFTKYAEAVKKLVPNYAGKIDQMAMQNMTSNASLTELMTKYKDATAQGNLTEAQLASYADAFASPDRDEAAKLDSATQVQLKLDAADAYSRAYRMAADKGDAQGQNTDYKGIYSYNSTILYTNIYQDLSDRFYNLKGTDAGLKAKRDETEKMQNQYADSIITWGTNCYNAYKSRTDLSKRELNYIKNTVQNLANVYQWKRDRARGVNPQDFDKFDALYKQFDTETDKYDKMLKG